MSSISISRGEGSSRSSRRPDNIRCHARGADGLVPGVLPDERARIYSTTPFRAPPAIDEVVVDHADRLHEGVDDCGAAEFKTPRLEVPG
jgi:hypothetical protein